MCFDSCTFLARMSMPVLKRGSRRARAARLMFVVSGLRVLDVLARPCPGLETGERSADIRKCHGLHPGACDADPVHRSVLRRDAALKCICCVRLYLYMCVCIYIYIYTRECMHSVLKQKVNEQL